jgi:hypothetical protein
MDLVVWRDRRDTPERIAGRAVAAEAIARRGRGGDRALRARTA